MMAEAKTHYIHFLSEFRSRETKSRQDQIRTRLIVSFFIIKITSLVTEPKGSASLISKTTIVHVPEPVPFIPYP
jgi:hypothetical protein